MAALIAKQLVIDSFGNCQRHTLVNTGNQPCRDDGEPEAGIPQHRPSTRETFGISRGPPKLLVSSATLKPSCNKALGPKVAMQMVWSLREFSSGIA